MTGCMCISPWRCLCHLLKPGARIFFDITDLPFSFTYPLVARVVLGTTDDFTTSFLHLFPVLHCPLGLAELQACPFLDVVFPPLPLSALSSVPFQCALQDGFGQT